MDREIYDIRICKCPEKPTRAIVKEYRDGFSDICPKCGGMISGTYSTFGARHVKEAYEKKYNHKKEARD